MHFEVKVLSSPYRNQNNIVSVWTKHSPNICRQQLLIDVNYISNEKNAVPSLRHSRSCAWLKLVITSFELKVTDFVS